MAERLHEGRAGELVEEVVMLRGARYFEQARCRDMVLRTEIAMQSEFERRVEEEGVVFRAGAVETVEADRAQTELALR